MAAVMLSSLVCLAGPRRSVPQSADYYWDYTVSGGVTGTYTMTPISGSMPVSGIVTGMVLQVIQPLTSSGSASIVIGNTFSNSGYVTSTAYSVLVDNYTKSGSQLKSNFLWDDINDAEMAYLMDATTKNDVIMTIGTQPLTAGKLWLHLDYIVPGIY